MLPITYQYLCFLIWSILLINANSSFWQMLNQLTCKYSFVFLKDVTLFLFPTFFLLYKGFYDKRTKIKPQITIFVPLLAINCLAIARVYCKSLIISCI